VYAYTRELNGKKMLIVLNFRNRIEKVNTSGINFNHARIILDNYATISPDETLRPYEAVVYTLQ